MPETPAVQPPAPPPIDVNKLADKVYQLLLKDARLGRARVDAPRVFQRDGEG